MSRTLGHAPVTTGIGRRRELTTARVIAGAYSRVRLRVLGLLVLLLSPLALAEPPSNAHRVVGHPPATIDGMRYSRPRYEFVRLELPTVPCADDPAERCYLPAHCIIVERVDLETCYWTSAFYVGEGYYVVPVRMFSPTQRVRIRIRNQVNGDTSGVVGWWRVMDLSTVSYEAEAKRRAVRK